MRWLLSTLSAKKPSISTRIESKISVLKEMDAVNHERLTLAFQANQKGIWDWYVGEKAMWLSPHWHDLLGYPPDALPAEFKIWEQLILPADYVDFKNQLDDFIAGKSEQFNTTQRFQHFNGDVVYLECRAACIRNEKGTAFRIVGVLNDVTEAINHENELQDIRVRLQRKAEDLLVSRNSLKKAQQEAEQSQLTAENANSAKSMFLAMMSHELRTPMTGMMGMVDLLMDSELDQEQQKHLDMLRNSANNLLQILNDILDFSKIEAGQLQLESIRFDIMELAAESFQLFQIKADEQSIAYTLALSPELERIRGLTGDPVRLKQVITNLLSNALKFTPFGEVKLQIDVLEHGNSHCMLSIKVEDTGIGMTAEQQSRIFKAFTQADRSTTRHFGGTGLGLAIVKSLVSSMGGEIFLTSEQGKGSCFDIHLPFALQGQEKTANQEMTTIAGLIHQHKMRSLRILLAEDNQVNQMLITNVLTRWGHHVDWFEDGAQALCALQKNAYDLVLMDMRMPVMDGASATQAIRQLNEPLASIPIIGISADVMQEDVQQHMLSGLDDFIPKPVDWQQLLMTMQRVVPNILQEPIDKTHV